MLFQQLFAGVYIYLLKQLCRKLGFNDVLKLKYSVRNRRVVCGDFYF